MNVRAQTGQPTTTPTMAARAEHISLESDPDAIATPARSPRRKVRSTYALRSKLRGCDTELAILDQHYLSVRSVRPHTEPLQYEFDLRYANAKPVRVRHVSWFWLALALALALLACGALWSLVEVPGRGFGVLQGPTHPTLSAYEAIPRNPGPAPRMFVTALGTLAAALTAVFMFLRRTVESLEFISAHGEATLVSVTGGIGSARGGKKFFIELIKNIHAAKAARPQPRQQFLRDEMREHHRLRELGVLTQEQYEASKVRILAAH